MGKTRRKFAADFRGGAVRHEIVDVRDVSWVSCWPGIPT